MLAEKYSKVLISYAHTSKRPYQAFVEHFGTSLLGHEDEVIEAIKRVIPIQTASRSMVINRVLTRISKIKEVEHEIHA